MEYVKGVPYFYKTNQKIKSFPYLNKDLECDILIIGAGIDGVIANYYLAEKYNVALVDRSKIGAGCTSCATCLLEYQLDDFAGDLSKNLSERDIIDIYNMGLDSIEKLSLLTAKFKNPCAFSKRPTLLFSNSASDKKDMEKEYLFRKQNGLKCSLVNDGDYNFQTKCGIYAPNGGCEIDPYLFCKMLIENSKNQDSIFENTTIVKIEKSGDFYLCETSFGETIKCKKVVLATGFNFELETCDLCDNYVSYTIVTNPLPELKWKELALVQDHMEPYHYMRFLPDDRIICGGEDVKLKGVIDEKTALKKYDALLNWLKNLFPEHAETIKADYQFCGAFGSTENNMGIIGEDEKGLIWFVSCGANGIINAMYGIEIIEAIIEGKTLPLLNVFSPLRKK